MNNLEFAPLISAVGAAVFGAAVAGLLVRRLARRMGVVARNCLRRRHSTPTPLLGGVALAVGISVFFVIIQAFDFGFSMPEWPFWIAGMGVLLGLGIWDDVSPINAKAKFPGELLAAFLLCMGVLSHSGEFVFSGFFLVMIFLSSMFWIVALTNFYNFLDGLDGYCASQAIFTALALAGIAANQSLSPISSGVLCLALAGSAIGFLFHGFRPARLYLGDSGSLLLGGALAACALDLFFKDPSLARGFGILLTFSLPVLDGISVILIRIKEGRSPFVGDRSHLHHRFQRLGLSQLRSFWVLAFIGSTFSLVGFLVSTERLQVPWVGVLLAWVVFVGVGAAWLSSREKELYRSLGVAISERFQVAGEHKDWLLKRIRNASDEGEFDFRKISVVLIDLKPFIEELTTRPSITAQIFFGRFEQVLRAKLRKADVVVAISSHELAVFLSGGPRDETERHAVFSRLQTIWSQLQTELLGESSQPEQERIQALSQWIYLAPTRRRGWAAKKIGGWVSKARQNNPGKDAEG